MRGPGCRDARPTAASLVSVVASAAVSAAVLLGGAAPALAVPPPEPVGRASVVDLVPAEVEAWRDVVPVPGPAPAPEPEPEPEPAPAPEPEPEPEPAPGPDGETAPDAPADPVPTRDEVVARSTLTPALLVGTGCSGATVELPLVGPVTWWVDTTDRRTAASTTSVPVDPRATTRVRAVLRAPATFADGGDTAVWTVGPGADLDTGCVGADPDPGRPVAAPDGPEGAGPEDEETEVDGTQVPRPQVDGPQVDGPQVDGPQAGTDARDATGSGGAPPAGQDKSAARVAPAVERAAPASRTAAASLHRADPSAVVGAPVVGATAVAGTHDAAGRLSSAGRAAPAGPVEMAAASVVSPAGGWSGPVAALALLVAGGAVVGRHLLRGLVRPTTGSPRRD